MKAILLHHLLLVVLSNDRGVLMCRLPDINAPVYSGTDRIFVEYSCTRTRAPGCRNDLSGIGNLLMFYPAAYAFAITTGRDVVISDGSSIGRWCKILKCGFPLLSEMLDTSIKPVMVSHNDFLDIHKRNISHDERILLPYGLKVTASAWYQYTTPAVEECVGRITKCDSRDVACMERFAFRQLFPGGFRNVTGFSGIVGLSSTEFNNILTSPYDSLQRIDAGIHIRAQLDHLEKNTAVNLNISVAQLARENNLFSALSTKLTNYFYKDPHTRDYWKSINEFTDGIPRVFIACDDVRTREKFIVHLSRRSKEDEGEILPIFVNSSEVFHSKDYQKRSHGMVDPAFEWYLLSLCNVIFGWRGGARSPFSTFSWSASKVSMYNSKAHPKIYQLIDQRFKWNTVWDWQLE